MCTCVSTRRFFGRTLDVEASYDEAVVLTPRKHPLPFRNVGKMPAHHAIIGMAYVVGGYPLYYDAMNEKGLCMAGLHFPESCRYFPESAEKDNITPFEFLPWILGQCASVAEAMPRLQRMNLWDQAFSDALPLSPLHWMLADETQSVVIEACRDGLHIHENPVGVMTNEPPFPQQMANLRHFSPRDRGLGLPGDGTSPARFQRAVYGRENSSHESVSQFFHVMDLVSIPKGCVQVEGRDHYTVYTSCCDRKNGSYHYATYEHRGIAGVEMGEHDLDGSEIVVHPLVI